MRELPVEPSERIEYRATQGELDRRWRLVHDEMKQRGLDVLVMQNQNDWLGGYVKLFTDLPATNGYPVTVAFHVADAMTVVDMGPFGGRRELAGRDELRRGVGAQLTTPAFSSIDYTRGYHAQLLASDLRSRGVLRVGLVGQGAMPHGFVTTLREQLAGVAFEDATDAVDEIKAIKSSEEAEWIVLSTGCRTKPSLPSQGVFVQGCATMKSRRSRGERRRTWEANRASRRVARRRWASARLSWDAICKVARSSRAIISRC